MVVSEDTRVLVDLNPNIAHPTKGKYVYSKAVHIRRPAYSI